MSKFQRVCVMDTGMDVPLITGKVHGKQRWCAKMYVQNINIPEEAGCNTLQREIEFQDKMYFPDVKDLIEEQINEMMDEAGVLFDGYTDAGWSLFRAK